ncbi:hypothetical protein RclHR1_01490009 [Rhizophagus clarus]|uniref:High mobility group box domain-containing protein n=1 Tax=Rhizophagus clarus TaxID=94130 RepID=A0A2Z6R6J8_9GLOM|nr:hypothetical protein RclHR1_01490009 [Rhizophagus clarus]GES75633.1 high mobility group box domain-containing protein [Rhizophagus clarus]
MTKKSISYKGCSTFSIYEGSNYKNHCTSGDIVTPLPPNPNESSFSLSINFKTNEEVWYSSDFPFTMDRDELLMNSTVSRRAKRIKKFGIAENPPRPLNSFFIYTKNENNKSEYKNMRAKDRLKKIKERWMNEPKEIKDLFDCGASLAKERHARQHKGYQYTKKQRQKRQKNTIDVEDETTVPSNYSSAMSTTSLFSFDHLTCLSHCTGPKEHFPNNFPYLQFNDNTLQIPPESSVHGLSGYTSIYDQLEPSISSNLEMMNQHSARQIELSQNLSNSTEYLALSPCLVQPCFDETINFTTNNLSMNEIFFIPKISEE